LFPLLHETTELDFFFLKGEGDPPELSSKLFPLQKSTIEVGPQPFEASAEHLRHSKFHSFAFSSLKLRIYGG